MREVGNIYLRGKLRNSNYLRIVFLKLTFINYI